jgi:hypothetical protein
MKKLLTIFFITALSFVILTNFILASDEDELWRATDDPPAAAKSGKATDSVKLTNPLTGNKTSKSIPELLGQIISYAMGIIGSLALFMFIYGGITWMLSGGNAEQVTKGKNIIIWAALGIALIFMAYALVRFVISAIGGTT